MGKIKNFIITLCIGICLTFWYVILGIAFILINILIFFAWLICWITGNHPGPLKDMFKLNDFKLKKDNSYNNKIQ